MEDPTLERLDALHRQLFESMSDVFWFMDDICEVSEVDFTREIRLRMHQQFDEIQQSIFRLRRLLGVGDEDE